ncbi:MAG: hypothetical protein PHW52_02830 [Candidatus Pacebacteria bacterium]|nr:hypothetical protein [Candidatus Paceibacterota bacterium]
MKNKGVIFILSFLSFLIFSQVAFAACSFQDLKSCDRQGIISIIKDFLRSRQNDLTKWNTFTSNYGFEIKYPSNYSIFESPDYDKGVTVPVSADSVKLYITNKTSMFFCCEPSYVSVELLGQYFDDLEGWAKDQKFINDDNRYRIQSEGYVTFNGEKAYQIEAEPGIDSPGNAIVVNHDNKTYLIRSTNDFPFFEKIISTFKFLGMNKEKFQATEIVSDNLPDSIEFWTQANCPNSKTYKYIIPDGYDLQGCVAGTTGSHGGCATCRMSKIKLLKKKALPISLSDYNIMKTILFNTSKDELRVYSKCANQEDEPCEDGIILTRYNPSSGLNNIMGAVKFVSKTGNSGGLYYPIAITKDDRKIVFDAEMGSPGAGGSEIDYGFGIADISNGRADFIISVEQIATYGAIFFDGYSKVVYVDEGKNTPVFMKPGPINNGKIVSGDLINGTEKVVLSESYTSYDMDNVKGNVLAFKATKYVVPKDCSAVNGDGEWIDLIPECVIKEVSDRSIDLDMVK